MTPNDTSPSDQPADLHTTPAPAADRPADATGSAHTTADGASSEPAVQAAPLHPKEGAAPESSTPPTPGESPLPAETAAAGDTPRSDPDDGDAGTEAVRVDQSVPNNHGTVIGIQNNNEIQRLRGTPLPPDWIHSTLRWYVADDDMTKELLATLEAHRVAVIHAATGTGRYTTALHALDKLGVPTIRQVRHTPNEKVELEGLKDEDTGWILDLRHETQPLQTAFGLHLREVADHLRDTRSFVIVVATTALWQSVAGEAPGLAHQLAPAAGAAVARAYLDGRQPPLNNLEEWLSEDRIAAHLADATPARAVDWARKITTAVALNRSAAQPQSFAELVDFVLQSAQNWRSELLQWHTENTDSGHRTYLLAAAVLDEAPARTVYDAHIKLGTALGDTPTPTNGQRGPGIIELTDIVRAELGIDDRIRFRRPGYAEAVVDYFWVDRPHHVEAFTRWTAEQAALLPSELGIPLANRVSQWTTRYTLAKQSLTVLRATAAQWAASKNLNSHAPDLLVAAALDPVDGKLARNKYLDWAKAADTTDPADRKNTPVAVKRALAEAMAQLAPVYPKVALRRLADLAAHTATADVTEAVGDALMTLWDQEGFQGTVRTTLTDWFDAAQDHHTAAARRAFLHLAQRTTPDNIPILLTTNSTGPDPWALTGWRRALDGKATPQVQDAVNTWLDAALAHGRLRNTIIKTFTDAVFRSEADPTYLAPRYIAIHHAANGWEPAHAGQQPTERTILRDELLIALREADPTAPKHSPDAPTAP